MTKKFEKNPLNIIRLIFITFLFFIIGGCTSIKIDEQATSNKVSDELGTIVFCSIPQSIWQKNVSMGAALIVVDDIEVGRLDFGKKAYLHLKPGPRKIEIYVNDSYPMIPVILKAKRDWWGIVDVTKKEKIILAMHYKTGKVSSSTKQYAGKEWWTITDGAASVQKLNGTEPSIPVSFVHDEN
jgi:ABC-type Fe3+-citrate transport system substrate-binding protein